MNKCAVSLMVTLALFERVLPATTTMDIVDRVMLLSPTDQGDECRELPLSRALQVHSAVWPDDA
jgi:hypothetical protein